MMRTFVLHNCSHGMAIVDEQAGDQWLILKMWKGNP